jgi:adenylate kinase family enzyme
MVGQNVMGRAAEQRAQQDHETLLNEFQVQNEEMAKLQEIVDKQQEIISLLQKKES